MSLILHLLAAASIFGAAGSQPAENPSKKALPNPFFALDVSTKDAEHQTPEQQVQLVKKLGFDGWAPGYTADFPKALKAADEAQVPITAVYVSLLFDAAGQKYDASLDRNIELLRGRKTIVWLVVRSEKHVARSDANDRAAVEAIRHVADMADKVGVRIAIYPHNGDYIASIKHALQIARLAERKNVGVSFNLCHWLKVDGASDIKPLLEELKPHLFVVTINGADGHDPEFKDWSRYIQPLGQGDYDVFKLVRTLRRMGYDGPIGLQGYGLKPPVEPHLEQAIRTWRNYAKRIAEEKRRS